MALSSGRADRRRRILQDGRLGGEMSDSESSATSAADGVKGGAPRYAPPESSVSFGIASQILPTGGWSLAGATLAALATTTGLVAAHIYRPQIAGFAGERVATLFEVTSPSSLAALMTTVLAVLVVGLCGVVFGLRRHRSDDMRGVYRWWLTAAMSATLVTVCIATGLHQVVAAAIAAKVGWSPLAGDALWWLIPGAGMVGLVSLRLFFDLKESRLAATGAVLATVAGIVALAASQGWAPAAAEPHLSATTFAATHGMLIGVSFALLAYTRRIVLEAGGSIAAPVKRKRPAKKTGDDETSAEKKTTAKRTQKPAPKNATEEPADEPAMTPRLAPETSPRKQKKAKQAAAATEPSTTQWVDGSQGDIDDYGDDGNPRRKLSKAERKRLRRQKARQGRAA